MKNIRCQIGIKSLKMIKYLTFFLHFFKSLINSKDLEPKPSRNWIRICNSECMDPDPDPGGRLITDPPDPDRIRNTAPSPVTDNYFK
jgi:hypothetical protein